MGKPISPAHVAKERDVDLTERGGPIDQISALLRKRWSLDEQKTARDIDLTKLQMPYKLTVNHVEALHASFTAAGWGVTIGASYGFLRFILPLEAQDTASKEVAIPVTEPVPVWVQAWEESGWGIHDDGWTIHVTKEDAISSTEKRVKDMRAQEHEIYKGKVPEEYSRPCGSPYQIELRDAELLKRLFAAGNGGISGPGDRAPAEGSVFPSSITDSERPCHSK